MGTYVFKQIKNLTKKSCFEERGERDIYIERETERERQTDRERDRDRERHTNSSSGLQGRKLEALLKISH